MAQRKAKTLENQIQFLLQSFSWNDNEEALEEQVREIGGYLSEFQQVITTLGQSDEALSFKESYYHLASQYNSITSKLEDQKKRAKLLKGRSANDGDGEVAIEMKRLLEENYSLHESIKVGNAFVNQAMATRTDLASHNQSLNRIKDKASTVNTIFGSASSIMSSIRRQKLKHTIVMGVVAGLCICFLLWWWLRS
eukprot:TRINITY_DN1254_c0_g1_i1.p1 TRINITY_DN1254_c0_g1~~TRINITY_DN1254_c0_g1_i1.p1  ORF type:complete len:195 (-),score=36.65 TRINITY_DN1254_c0_g1_i1:31-615(-)